MAKSHNGGSAPREDFSRQERPTPTGGGKQASTRGRVIATVAIIAGALLVGVLGVVLLAAMPTPG
ncbi:hypothetical protein ICL81_03580 [Leucobacter sp. cx-328]|uniref:hypothetical protein n=1 Tax=unclassified Leucobacter TaxID=2621730 RepID=UPI00165DA4A1|nr:MULTISPECIES: hypothetical protein [unclassified Leucobacter]MBC9943607.1 hypothetical protein [Leucobacter sp. cx-328]